MTLIDHYFQTPPDSAHTEDPMMEGYTTLDVLSADRAQLGIGAAWYDREHHGLGVPFPSHRRALRGPRGGPPDLPPNVERR